MKTRTPAISAIILTIILCLALSAVLGLNNKIAQASADQELAALIAQAEALFDRWHTGSEFQFVEYEQKLRRAIALWEGALPLLAPDAVQTRARVLDRLAQAYFELAIAYLQSDRERDRAYGQGKDYALEGLQLEPEFAQVRRQKGFRAALHAATDIAAIFWYGNNLGRWLNYHKLTALTGGVQDVLAAFERSAELDASYLAGGPERALAAFLAQVPGFLGGGRERAKGHFERALQLGPDFLENYVNYAEFYAQPVRDWGLFCRLLREALDRAQDDGVMAKWPLYNTLALERAQALWDYRYHGKQVCQPD